MIKDSNERVTITVKKDFLNLIDEICKMNHLTRSTFIIACVEFMIFMANEKKEKK